MDISKADLKMKCKSDFEKYGWVVSEDYKISYGDNKTIEVDFALIGSVIKTDEIYYTNKFGFDIECRKKIDDVCGYVIVIHPESKEDIKEIREKLKILLEEIKPLVLFLTEGNVFETYFNGKYFDTLMFPIKTQNIESDIRMFSYMKKFVR